MITKEKLAVLPIGYCISLMELQGRQYCITASEDRDGELLLIDTQTKSVQKVTGLSGGVMSILPIPEREGEFLAIQRFYPVFDSKEAEIVHCRLGHLDGETIPATVRTVADLPYVHRIALTGTPQARTLVAATLCHGKDYIDDWSKPGAVYSYRLDSELNVFDRRLLLDGIYKNHGMYQYRKTGGMYVLVSGEQGVWVIDGTGACEKLCNEPVSDLCMFDVDGDGMDEMICIAPFHGDTLKVLKKSGDAWITLAQEKLSFGHAVWCGLCSGAPVILACNRGGDRATTLYRPVRSGEKLDLTCVDVDLGVGATNIAVQPQAQGLVLYAANHGCDETARYMIEL